MNNIFHKYTIDVQLQFCISYSIGEHIGKYDTLPEIVTKRKLRLFGHVVTRLRAKGTPSCRVQFRGRSRGRPVGGWTM